MCALCSCSSKSHTQHEMLTLTLLTAKTEGKIGKQNN